MAANNQDIDIKQARRNMDKHNLYLPYLRELGAMIILAMVLYGVWDVIKTEGRLIITTINKNTSAVEGLISIQDKLLSQLNRMEVSNEVSRRVRLGTFVGPSNPAFSDSLDQ